MLNCLLCTEEHGRGNQLTAELQDGFTVQDAIKQFFVSEAVSKKKMMKDPAVNKISIYNFSVFSVVISKLLQSA